VRTAERGIHFAAREGCGRGELGRELRARREDARGVA
jgi:hypothetical protein